MQLVQLTCVLILIFVPLRSGRDNECWRKSGPVVHWCLTHLNFFIVPVCSIIYWYKESQTVGGDGFLSPWFLVYPLMNILTIFPYYAIVLNIMKTKRKQIQDEDLQEYERLEQLD